MVCGTAGASQAMARGERLAVIGKLLGHTRIEMAARYAHLKRDTEEVSATKTGGNYDVMTDRVGAGAGTIANGCIHFNG